MTEANSDSQQGDGLRVVHFGPVAIHVRDLDESMLLGMDLRYQAAVRRAAAAKNEDEAERVAGAAAMKLFEDMLFRMVPDPDDQDRAIGALVDGHVTPDEMIKLLSGHEEPEPSNRQERRAAESAASREPQRRSGGRRGHRGRR